MSSHGTFRWNGEELDNSFRCEDPTALMSQRDAALRELRSIVDGIDRDETEDGSGWWETSTGADFGAERLRLLEDLVVRLTGS